MRCPKCGYISFDHLEACTKCHSDLSAITNEINGTTYHVTAPKFLHISTGVATSPLKPASKPHETAKEAQMVAETSLAALDDDTDFSLDFEQEDEQEVTVSQDEDGLVLQLSASMPESTAKEEIAFDLEEPEKSHEEAPDITLDFGDLDISDLAPPSKEPAGAPIHFAAPSSLSDDDNEAPPPLPTQATPAPTALTEEAAQGLEDLQFNGLDLDSPAKLVTGSAAGKRFLPSVKTGTALDKFDIDLGELFADGKGEKAKNY